MESAMPPALRMGAPLPETNKFQEWQSPADVGAWTLIQGVTSTGLQCSTVPGECKWAGFLRGFEDMDDDVHDTPFHLIQRPKEI
ncbi:MAG: hypothetical protein Q8S02_12395 [Hydrogenophaga sp.]|nr:hypothetical protein [Hydrogenophaga sp.]